MFTANKFKNKKACVLGMGKSGIAAAKLLKRHGFAVLISEEKQVKPAPGLKGIEVETGGHSVKVLECGFIVKSPGISHNHPLIKKLKRLKKPVFSEIEIARAFAPKDIKIFAITGTNGKTTTTELLSRVLREHVKLEGKKRKVYTVGNVGTPFAEIADKMESGSLVVIEVSSYQLEDSVCFRPYISAILNITPDHLEHHGSFKKYIEAKKRIFELQQKDGALILNGGDKVCAKFARRAPCRVFCFSTTPRHTVRINVFYDGDELIFADGRHLKPPPKLPGIHNIENAMAVALMAFAAGVSPQAVQKGFNAFASLEHRLEFFAEHKGIKCYNDSKATNVDSTAIALKALQSKNKIWLILGGQDKGFPYTPLFTPLKKHCKEVVLIGEAEPLIKRALAGQIKTTDKGNIKNAVEYIFKNAAPGDIMLLSPACASFDQFKNFEDRGRQFKKTVLDYIKQNGKV